MTDIAQVSLPAELKAVQQHWRGLPRTEQDALYAKEFAAPFAKLFADLPLHGAPASMAGKKPRFLVSILGLSWQPVALMAAWCRPERMLVIGTEESLGATVAGEGVLSLIARVAGIDRDAIESTRVPDSGETDIYRAVRDFLRSGVPHREVFIDPTGGKKSMSASAALAGFLAGTPLVYVDYTQYHEKNRIPIAGTEYPRLLTNPLEVLGDLELRDIFAAFNRSDFEEAERLARRLSERLYEPREAQALTELAGGYAAWDRFNFEKARERLTEAKRILAAFTNSGNWGWAGNVRDTLAANLQSLNTVAGLPQKPTSIEEGLPLVIWYVAKAQRMMDAEKTSLAVLLLYAAVERYMGLCLRIEYSLDDKQPDYSYVKEKIDWKRFDEVGKALIGKNYTRRELNGPLMFTISAQLLATLAPHRLDGADLGLLNGLSNTRNKCEYEHGFLPRAPKKEDVQHYLPVVKRIVERCCGQPQLDDMLARYCFPKLPNLAAESSTATAP
ncbi:MAG TPA: hypothetical protein VKX45_21145 [Bryobacteraceae bacterium]|jgi:hypothetical protein|nr:hypothetical protein [Bryobacteraceae bacterium]